MVRRIATLALLSALASAPAASAAKTPLVALPISAPTSLTVPPPGFTTTAKQAMAIAKATPQLQTLHKRLHPLWVQPELWDHQHWFVSFFYRDRQVGEVDVSSSGRVMGAWTGPLAIAVYARGNYAPLFGSPWVLVPFCVCFLVPFVDPRRWRARLHLDALAILSLLGSYLLFDAAHLEAAVWLLYPPLIYLMVRMLGLGVRRAAPAREVLRLPPVSVLGVGLVLLTVARTVLSLVNYRVIDVGLASVIGAHRIAHGMPIYDPSLGHSDTYGPIAYLAYVPFESLFPWRGGWDYLLSAHLASVAFDLLTIVGLVALGRRLREGPRGVQLGLALGWAWAACPFTLLGLLMHTNDGLMALLSVAALLVFASPPARGAMLGLAAAAKFTPALLLPLFAAQHERGRKAVIACAGAFVLVVALSIGLFLPSGGLREFYDHTIGYQLSRPDVFSIWALHPSLNALKVALEAAVILMAGVMAFVPRQRTLSEVCALAGALTIAVQLPAVHWFYYYVVWFLPFVLVALLGREPLHPASAEQPASAPERVEEAVLVAA